MLSTTEIVELEKKVSRYRIKHQIRYVIYVLLALMIIGGGIYFYYNIFYKKQSNEIIDKNTTTQIIQLDSNVSKQIPTETIPEKIVEKKQITENKREETLTLHLPILTKNNADSLMKTVEKKQIPKEEELESRMIVRKKSSSAEETFYRSIEETIQSGNIMDPPPLGEEKQKGLIKIETQEVNSIQYLKEKFEKTHNIIFAIMLAEEYYLSKNYALSNKWALIANSIDADNEKSWLWFAKSKVKLGQKEDALVALQAYLKKNKSNAIQSLLNQINLGEIND